MSQSVAHAARRRYRRMLDKLDPHYSKECEVYSGNENRSLFRTKIHRMDTDDPRKVSFIEQLLAKYKEGDSDDYGSLHLAVN